jgi:hypothetical protein
MKTILTIMIVVLGGYTTLMAQTTPKFEFKSEMIDYGSIEKGSDGVRVFEFKNIGDAPLIIESVKSSCGCTVPTWPKEAIQPGKTGKIEVKYDTSRVGPIRKTITIYSNNEEPIKALKIKGEILDPNAKS